MAIGPRLEAAEAAARAGDRHALRSARAALQAALQAAPALDPLLAVACLPHVEDGALRARLEAAAASGRPTSARCAALCTDATGEGHLIELLVDLVPGDGEVWTPEAVARDSALAVQVAVAAALGGAARQRGVRWQLLGAPAGATLSGGSLGLAAGLAALAAQRGVQLPTEVAVTGGLDLSGVVQPVAGVPAKLRAAAAAGRRRALVPAGEPLRPVPGLEVHPVRSLAEAAALALPEGGPSLASLAAMAPPAPPAPAAPAAARPLRARARAALPWAGAGLGLLLGALNALAPIDLLIGDQLQLWARGARPATATVVLAVGPEVDLVALRPRWAAEVEALAAAGARAVVFDLVFSAPQPGDAALAAALRAATAAMVLAVRARGGRAQGPADPALAALPLGVVAVEHDLLLRRVRQAPAALWTEGGAAVPHLAAAALAAAEGAEPPRVVDDTLRVGLRAVPLHRGRLRLAPVEAPPRLVLGGDYSAAKGKIVVIGAVDHPGDQHATAAGPRQGVELVAALIETLAAQAAPARLPLRAELPLLAAPLALQLALGRRLGPWRVAAGLVLGLVGLAALLASVGWELPVAAAVVGVGVVGWGQGRG